MVIPPGLSIRREISMLCKSMGLAALFPLPPRVSLIALLVLVRISLSELATVSCLAVVCDSITSSVILEIFTAPSGEDEGADCSGGDGTGEDECLPLVEVAEENPDFIVDFGGPATTKGYKNYRFNTNNQH